MDLAEKLRRLDGKSYGAYKSIKGRYDFALFTLFIEYVQGDPFASPSRFRLLINKRVEKRFCDTSYNRDAVADFVLRWCATTLQQVSYSMGSGKSGLIHIDRPGQEILRRSACTVGVDGQLTLRFSVGLPAAGRRILGRKAAKLVCSLLPDFVEGLWQHVQSSKDQLANHLYVNNVQEHIRKQLVEHDIVAFVRNGSLLPRKSGDSDKPLANAIPFISPQDLTVTLVGPNGEVFVGMGIPRGITLICGGGYHGKSTLMQAISRGIYNHIQGDGREGVVSLPSTLQIRAEDGRSICGVDISPFLSKLPNDKDTTQFCTVNASGSTSQAACVVEAIELGVKLMLFDEDTSASNFLYQDRRMQQLVPSPKEPITPLIDHLPAICSQTSCSTILVMGGNGGYFEVADTVLMMDNYNPQTVTSLAQEIASTYPTQRLVNTAKSFSPNLNRVLGFSFPAKMKIRDRWRIDVQQGDLIFYGLDSLVCLSQTKLLKDALLWLKNHEGCETNELAEIFDRAVATKDLVAFSKFPQGDRAKIRGLDLLYVLNRFRNLSLGVNDKTLSD